MARRRATPFRNGHTGFERRLMEDLVAVGVRCYAIGELTRESTVPQGIPVFVDWLTHLEERIPGAETPHREAIRADMIRNLNDPAAQGNRAAIDLLVAQLQRRPPLSGGAPDYAARAPASIATTEDVDRIVRLLDEVPPEVPRGPLIEYLGGVRTPEAREVVLRDIAADTEPMLPADEYEPDDPLDYRVPDRLRIDEPANDPWSRPSAPLDDPTEHAVAVHPHGYSSIRSHIERQRMTTSPMGIAGLGAVSGYGWGAAALWKGMTSGKPAATLHPGYGPEGQDAAWLARISDEGDPMDGLSRFSRAMRAAAREALTDAAERGWRPGARVGLLHAVVISEVEGWREFYLKDHARRRIRDYLTLMPSTPVSMLMQENDFHGPAMNVSAMCASGNAALITAKMWLDTGFVDDVVFVSTDLSLTPENVEHFVRLGVGVVDTEPLDACRPFQEGSRGFPAGEAAVAFVLSQRVADPYVHVLGGAMTHDAYHLTSVDPSRLQVESCVRDALSRSGVAPADVAYMNAHGPGTQQCDAVEAGILDELLGGAPHLYSVKPMTGHCQGAAAAIEIAVAALGYAHHVVAAPPTVAAGHRRLLDGPTPMERGITLKTSLGMGGHNAAVVLSPAA